MTSNIWSCEFSIDLVFTYWLHVEAAKSLLHPDCTKNRRKTRWKNTRKTGDKTVRSLSEIKSLAKAFWSIIFPSIYSMERWKDWRCNDCIFNFVNKINLIFTSFIGGFKAAHFQINFFFCVLKLIHGNLKPINISI